jgi:hypothetical protein
MVPTFIATVLAQDTSEAGLRREGLHVLASAKWIPWLPKGIQRATTVVPQTIDIQIIY